MQSIEIPDKFNMVDMGGIDLLEAQGETVPGLYNKLVESITLCRYQCLYNWSFNGILIPPTYVEMKERSDGVWINEGVMVDEEDVVYISVSGPAYEVLQLNADENGTYNAPSGYIGFNPVIVDVPPIIPNIESITISENGVYSASGDVDGYSPIEVDIPTGGNTTYTGSTVPDSQLGSDGDWYIMYTTGCKIRALSINTGIDVSNVFGFKFVFQPLSVLNQYQTYLASVIDDFTVGMASNSDLSRVYLRIRGAEKLAYSSPSGMITIEARNGAISTSSGQTSSYNSAQSLGNSSGDVVIGALSANRYSEFVFVSLELYDSDDEIIDTFSYDSNSNAIVGSGGSLPQTGPGTITEYQLGDKVAYHKENGIWVQY